MAFGGFDQNDNAPMSEINTTPLVDVMLVLLVVFIVTAPVMTHSIRVDLPKAKAEVTQIPPAVLRVTLTATGQVEWEKTPIKAEELPIRFATAMAKDAQTELHLLADKEVRYELIAQTMSAARQAGLTKIGLLTDGNGS
ncbi:ExbD/TolR family protein [Iodobacter arcticus]|uniref:ExbD/TolR family protein n=1 Tax=Iodobacter arcticus TaxID=590593 RepID=A0ABW2QVW6_9NEIS